MHGNTANLPRTVLYIILRRSLNLQKLSAEPQFGAMLIVESIDRGGEDNMKLKLECIK